MIDDIYAALRRKCASGQRIQANRGTREHPSWVTLPGVPEFSCDADLYRVHPDDETDALPTAPTLPSAGARER